MLRDSHLKTLLLLACVGGLTSACEMKKNLDDMHKSTVEMNETTKRMEEKTGELDKKSESLDNKTAELYDALRQGNAALLRKEFLQQLNESKEMAKKLSLGVKYFWAYEFQLWSMQGLDNDHRREELASSAAREFIREIHEYAPTEDFISPTSDDNRDMNFLALVTILHEVNDKQKNRVDPKGIEHMSMLSLIERALKQKSDLDAGRISLNDLKASSYDLLAFESKLIQILQARQNFILTMLVAKASNIDKGLKNKVKLGLLGMKWTLDLSKYNDVEVNEMTRYLKAVLDTRKILKDAGHAIEVDDTIQKVLMNGQIAKAKKQADVRAAAEGQIITYIQQVRSASVVTK
ncbi:hypothetical protein AB1A81_03730 [Bdellovibrio bacteriovorus]|uniref:Lipoprotein n=1 Tax=Bdellovibrio bacteriovorus (strain ATCC 15356 / DSM 50701 / NCIMB 9529 / HD100) TaxID=264462 RepID=Q6MPN5_BDEBA|nr:hypothetical protein [Bdellovibrio bacteriovorus]CAE78762.1 hypothetical protein predicted by Glimmer/Critica [Bdellovibrio bacteriovorus HD100]